jgi:predicted ATPase with chaperone activity
MYGNMNVFVLEPCYCGNRGDVYRECKCSERAIARWRNRDEYKHAMQAAEMWVEIAYVPFEKLASARKPESDETIMQRVNAGRAYWKKPVQLSAMDNASQRLMAAAMNQLMLSEPQVQQVLSVTASIVALNEGRSSVSCLAEALQYRMR